VRADQIADYLGLRGDSSDNIPGVPGIGEKRASKLRELNMLAFLEPRRLALVRERSLTGLPTFFRTTHPAGTGR
ncbi:MAG: 5'-3' exonuclease H3TH domain-containing protein, partial [Pseudomonadota bacterium]